MESSKAEHAKFKRLIHKELACLEAGHVLVSRFGVRRSVIRSSLSTEQPIFI